MQRILKDLAIILIFSYGLLHMSYKYMLPDLANQDFAKYNAMMKAPLDMQAAEAPFVLRQVPTGIAHLLKEAGIFYRSRIIGFHYSQFYQSEEDQRNFFALILANYLAWAVSLLLIVNYVRKSSGDDKLFTVLALGAGYFMVPISVIAPLTHGYAWLACVLMAIGLFERRIGLIWATCILSFFSRETVILFFCPFVALLVWANRGGRFYIASMALLIAAAVSFFLVRRFMVHGHEEQLSAPVAWGKIWRYVTGGEFIFQTFLTQCAVAYLCYHIYRRAPRLALTYLVSVAVIVALSILIMLLGIGRIIGESYPLLIMLFCLPAEKLRQLAPSRR